MNQLIRLTWLALLCPTLVVCGSQEEQTTGTSPPVDAAPATGESDLSADAAATKAPDGTSTAAAKRPDPVGSRPDAAVPDAAVPDAAAASLTGLIASLPGDAFDPNVKRIPGVGGIRRPGKLGVNSPGVGGSGANEPPGDLPSTGSMAQVRYGAISVTGCDVSRVRPTMERFLGGFRYCYDQQLAANRNLAGNLTLRMQITPAGAVPSATVAQSTLSNSEIESCVARIARRLIFPEATGACSLTVPINFAAQ